MKDLFLIVDMQNVYLPGQPWGCERAADAATCILSTVFDLIDMGKKVIYLKKCIAGKTPEKEDMVIKLLKGLSPLHLILH